MSTRAGEIVDGRYQLASRLGEGTFGEVWRALDTRLSQRPVAVKFLKPEFVSVPEAVARFEAEADALSQVRHPNVVAVHDRGRWQGHHFLVTEFVEGEALTAWIERQRATGALPPVASALALFEQLCAGMEAAHAVRAPGPIVHRDLKPDNVMVGVRPDGTPWVKVLDFGIAQLGGRSSTRTGALMGTPLYMAPEQALGNTAAVGPWTDVFSLAVIATEMLTLRAQIDAAAPWWGTAMQRPTELRALLSSLRGDVPGDVWRVLADALSQDVTARPRDAGALRARALQAMRSPTSRASVAMADTLGVGVNPTLAPLVSASRGGHLGAVQAPSEPRVRTELSAPPPPPSTTAPSMRALPGAPPASSPRWPVAVGAIAVTAVGVAAFASLGGSGSEPSSPPRETAPPPRTSAPAAEARPLCRLGSPTSFHLRPRETVASVGPELPAGTEYDVLAAGALTRGDATIHRVRVATSGALGWTFLRPAEIARCAALQALSATRAADAQPGARPIPELPALEALMRRWTAAVVEGHGAGDLDDLYAERVQFRGSGGRATVADISRYFSNHAAAGGVFSVDWSRSEWTLEPLTSPDAPRACAELPDAVGGIIKVRAWASEYARDRASASSGEVPCDGLEGRYLFRLREVDGALRICHETWSLREGVCASCPAARACAR